MWGYVSLCVRYGKLCEVVCDVCMQFMFMRGIYVHMVGVCVRGVCMCADLGVESRGNKNSTINHLFTLDN